MLGVRAIMGQAEGRVGRSLESEDGYAHRATRRRAEDALAVERSLPRLRPMRKIDLAEVHAVECAAYDYPWAPEIFHDCLEERHICWVMECDRRIGAHGIMSVGAGECQILNLCVHPRWQRRGIGRRLLRHLLGLARRRGADTAFLEVRVGNLAARTLYAAEGFCELGMRRGYYPHAKGREDAVMLARVLDLPQECKE